VRDVAFPFPFDVEQARQFVLKLADYIIPRADVFPGIRARVRQQAQSLGRTYVETDPLINAVFFVPDEDRVIVKTCG
jgi:hypothetical protein